MRPYHITPDKIFHLSLFKDCSIKNISYKKIEILPLVVYITPDEIQETYVEINDDMLLNANIYNALIQKSKQ